MVSLGLLVVLGISLALIVGVPFLEKRMLYYPMPFPQGNWDTAEFPGTLEECVFSAEDGVRIHGWFASASPAPPRPSLTLLFFHGNAGNISHRLVNIAYLIQLGVNVFIIDYRGYGKSQGTPGEKGLYLDAVAAYDYLVEHQGIPPEQIILFGRSLGGAVAIDLATKRRCRQLIVESTFTSIRDMATTLFGRLPVSFLLRSHFDSLSKIGSITVPVLCIHGTQDSIVPFEFGKRLFEAANVPKSFYAISGADHNDTYDVGGQEYWRRFSEFIVHPVSRAKS